MRSSGYFPRSFSVSWSVEGPFEATSALAHEIEDYGPRGRALSRQIIFTNLAMLAFFAGVFCYRMFLILYAWLYGADYYSIIFWEDVPLLSISAIGLALSGFSFLLLFQGRRLMDVLGSRFQAVDDLWESTEKASKASTEDKPPAFDPVGGSFGMLDEVLDQLPQMVQQHLVALNLILATSLVLIASPVFLPMAFGWGFPLFPFAEDDTSILLVLQLVIGILGGLSVLALYELLHFINAIQSRYAIILATTRAPPSIPPQEDRALDRFKGYIGSRLGMDLENLKSTRGFDIFAKHEGMVLMVRMVKMPTKEDIKKMARDANKIQDQNMYARAILLCSPEDNELLELPDEVVEELFANDILLPEGAGGARDITHVQIIVDEGDMYSMVPFVPDSKMG